MKRSLILLPLSLACGSPPVLPPNEPITPPIMQPDPMPSTDCESQEPNQMIAATGEASGFWSGRVELTGQVVVPSGEKLEICPGTTIVPTTGSSILVQGELTISGTSEEKIVFEEINWTGLSIEGKLSGGYATLGNAGACIAGRAGSEIDLVSVTLTGCGQSISVANGGRFDRLTIIGGPVFTNGGMLTMIDSTIDLRHPGAGPDAMVWSGGGANLDHLHITGTHCPIHMGRAPDGVSVTHTLFDGASVPVMIAQTSGVFAGNNVIGGSPQLQDVGGSVELDAGGNYWGGGPASVSGSFSNLDDYSTTPLSDVGPR